MENQQIKISKVELAVGIIIGLGAGCLFWFVFHTLVLAAIFLVGSIVIPILLYLSGLLDIQ